ncbi:hypothetical protein [Porticoccus sp.]
MRLAIVLLTALALSGCGTYKMMTSDEPISFAIVSEGKIGGLYGAITGEGGSCKVTVFGDVSDWQVYYKGESCTAVLNGGGVEP